MQNRNKLILRNVKGEGQFDCRAFADKTALKWKNSENIFAKKGYEISTENGIFYLKKNNLRIKLGNSFDAAYASIVKEEYNFCGAADEKFVVFDIGLNIGLTTLYLAQNKNIAHIYGFEPFKETFEKARENIMLNPELSKKISIFNFGLEHKNIFKQIRYNSDKIGQMCSIGDRFPNEGKLETIEVRNASQTLLPLIEKHSENIALKMDCEGAEHYILPDLAVSGALKKIKIVVMEWHRDKPEFFVRLLRSNGFYVFCNHEIVNYQGIIRAVRIY